MSLDLTWLEVFVAGIATIAIYSFLYRENPFYRFFEHLYIGIATGIILMLTVKTFLWPQVISPLLGLDVVVFPDGTLSKPYDTRNLLLLLPMTFGCFYYFILFRRLSWLAHLAIGFSLGTNAGFAFLGTFTELLPQLYDSFRPLYIKGNFPDSIGNIVFIFTLFTALTYFFFTFKRKPGGPIERASSAGRLMMMACFGAFFGSTIAARMALLVERLDFLLLKWIPNFW